MKTILSHWTAMEKHEIPSWVDTSNESIFAEWITAVDMNEYRVKKSTDQYNPLVDVDDDNAFDDLFAVINIKDLFDWKNNTTEDKAEYYEDVVEKIIFGGRYISIKNTYYKRDITVGQLLDMVGLGYITKDQIINADEIKKALLIEEEYWIAIEDNPDVLDLFVKLIF